MLTILVEIIMSVFIANFKASEHPIISAVARGILIMISIFFVGSFSFVIKGESVPVFWGLIISFFCGIACSFTLLLIEVFGNYIDREK
ncbi:hypothetical protein [Acinetobacter sp. ESBL14]|uniref:hypothetical protein n=1 Tax=Acinetobacter sp. ESBL14 TaxID=3077329 RepID=UPI002FC5BA75